MINLPRFFADTYAFIEIAGGNKNYQKYLQAELVTTQWNLAELYYHFLRIYDEVTAEKWLLAGSSLLTPITKNSIRAAMRFKLAHAKENVEFVK